MNAFLDDLMTALSAGLMVIGAAGAGESISEVMVTVGSVPLNGFKQDQKSQR